MKLKIATRISLVIGALLFLFFVTSIVALILTMEIAGETAQLIGLNQYDDDVFSDIEESRPDYEAAILGYARDGNEIDRKRAYVLGSKLDGLAEQFRENHGNSHYEHLARPLVGFVEELTAFGNEILQVVETTGAERFREEHAGSELVDRFQASRQNIERYLHTIGFGAADEGVAADRIDHSISKALLYLLSMTAFGVIIGGIAGVVLTKGLVRPIRQLIDGAEAIGRGTLDHRIPTSSDDEIGQLARSFNRMAENRQQAEEVLRDLAHHDPLTRLPNRALFQTRLDEALDNARRVDRRVALHCLDLNKFKQVNDTLGHPAGDKLLKQVAARLLGCIRVTDTVARLGGDEFAIIQTNLENDGGIDHLASRVHQAISEPFDLDGEQVFTGTSIGIAVYPGDTTDSEKLLKFADLTLYRAKNESREAGGLKFVLFDHEMNTEIVARKAMEDSLRHALDNDELYVAYQPQIDLATGDIAGAEALVRWDHPERGPLAPDKFIPVAEQSGLISALTEFVMRRACACATGLQKTGLRMPRISVNLSPVDFKQKDLIPILTRILDESRLDPASLELEITEGMVMWGIESVIETLQALSDLGIELAIDDFGTGYSSMSYLKQFPVNRLKIDKCFVQGIESTYEDACITKAIIKLGHSLRLKVVAEGVQTQEQLDFQQERDCDEIRGYYVSRSLTASAFAKFVGEHGAAQFQRPAAQSA